MMNLQDYKLSLSIEDNATTSDEGPTRIIEMFNKQIKRAPSPPKNDHDIDSISESELGLSLRLQTSSCEKEEKKEELANFESSSSVQNKIQRIHEMSGITSHAASPPNRKARVSVRARCETATVSSKINTFLPLLIMI